MPTSSTGLRRRIAVSVAGLLAANLAVWAWAAAAFQQQPALLGTALIAYTLGLRHAVDADHIAAIDNVTRALMQKGERPVGVGLFFSLGHSSVVILACVAIGLAAPSFLPQLEAIHRFGSTFGTTISAAFLLAIAAMNLTVLVSTWRAFRQAERGGGRAGEAAAAPTLGGGALSRLLRPLFRLIRRSWHMYPLGFLFGLGFDTATEIALLGISVSQSSHGMPPGSFLVFPALFTAGMSLVDTIDSVLMLGAYGWAFVRPARKLRYNVVMTFISVVVAAFVGGIEALSLLADRLDLRDGLRAWLEMLAGHFGTIGFSLIGLFLTCWIMSAGRSRMRRARLRSGLG